MMRLPAAVSCDIGQLRSSNQDHFYLDGLIRREVSEGQEREFMEYGIYAVFDGMGATEQGEYAAHLAAKAFEEYAPSLAEGKHPEDVKHFLRRVNRLICRKSEKYGAGMGTTVVIAMIEKNKAHIYNIGDSRGYLYREGALTLLSVDDTNAQSLLDVGVQVKNERLQHQLTQYLGMREEEFQIEPHYCTVPWDEASKLLLCSDGLWNVLSEENICNIFGRRLWTGFTVRMLTELAKRKETRDNVTALIVGDTETG